jgi:hypothetical protein
MDWLTTVIGIVYFGAIEGNPFLSEIARTNLPVFTAIKLGTAFFVAFMFNLAERALSQSPDKSSRAFVSARYLLRGAYAASMAFLLFAVINNVMIVVSTV